MRSIQSLVITLLVAQLEAIALAQPSPAPAGPPDPAPPDEPAGVSAAVEPTKPWKIGIAPRVGFVVPTSKLGAMVVGGLELDYVLPAANRQLFVAVDLSLTRPSYDAVVMDPRIPSGSGMYTIHETEMVIGLMLGYRVFPADRALVPWAAIGPILHLLRTSESTTFAPGDNTATSTEFGLEIAVGADYRVGPGFAVGGARLTYSKLDHTLTGDTNAGKLGFDVGYRIVF